MGEIAAALGGQEASEQAASGGPKRFDGAGGLGAERGLGLAEGRPPRGGARTRDALWTALGRLLGGFSPDERRYCLTNSGYGVE